MRDRFFGQKAALLQRWTQRGNVKFIEASRLAAFFIGGSNCASMRELTLRKFAACLSIGRANPTPQVCLVGISVLVFLFGLSLQEQSHAQTETIPQDKFLWLEDAHSEKALNWVRHQNALTSQALMTGKDYPALLASAHELEDSRRALLIPSIVGARMFAFEKNTEHPRGIWKTRRAESYRGGASERWDVLLDIDDLARQEKKDWTFAGSSCSLPDARLCIVSLSDGGGDAVEAREFNVETRRFVADGFHLDRSKQTISWFDDSTLIVARGWKSDGSDLSASGYPTIVKRLHRGDRLVDAKEVFAGTKSDVRVSAKVLHSSDNLPFAVQISRQKSFFDTDEYLVTNAGTAKIDLPPMHDVFGVLGKNLIVAIDKPWRGFSASSLLSLPLDSILHGTNPEPALVCAPQADESFQDAKIIGNRIALVSDKQVQGTLSILSEGEHGWNRKEISLPKSSTIEIVSSSQRSNYLLVTSESFLQPLTLWSVDANKSSATKVTSQKDSFDAKPYLVEQLFAKSKDGTSVPYFVVRRRDMKFDGRNPTLIYAYGGFGNPVKPTYWSMLGRGWLEKGGVYVLATLRGGGEFDEAWHTAGMREGKQHVFDDHAAVAADLISRHVTAPAYLGAFGGSNGGLVTAVELNQHPELFSALGIYSPITDMLRFPLLGSGASYVAEYGDPSVGSDRSFLIDYSPYQSLRSRPHQFPALIIALTNDDRVHPAHARKLAARMEELGTPYFYYEIESGGGHENATVTAETQIEALSLEYFSKMLMH